jgi:O-methyltransferase
MDRKFPVDFEERDIVVIRQVEPYTLTSGPRIVALCHAVRYIVEHAVPGALVECGVWKGGSMMAAALVLLEQRVTDRDLYLFDTFAGRTEPKLLEPTKHDVSFAGIAPEQAPQIDAADRAWLDAPLQTVRGVMESTGYPAARVHYVEGPVEATIPEQAPDEIALVRLDTDWYESTKHEWEQLYPRVSRGGIIIIDDYGHWQGSRKATDEYLARTRAPLLLTRIDYTGRLAVKLEERAAAGNGSASA